ncbi:ABC-type Zn2+ transport system, periplasmic component/surface adhesin [Oleiphilus messinensis]|uniref:High-affinity zinc uptake system protein ZnuA n=2 Tax=Oleiphilus messinensis TaxID=141451 RepID=A0A1Y0I913_9GAMM|nr:ABC-type Zn2+ transport system, periplasmic component/surface adhesin [Oleiphilus messinensis]
MLIRSIAGTNIQIDVLLPPGSNPHFYQLKPSDITKMKNAKEVFWIGEGFEVYLKKVFTAHQIRNTTIEALAGVELDDEPHTHHDQNGAIHKLSEQGHQDPHLWLDPYLMLDIIPEVRSRLSKFYPESAGAFAKNSEQTTTAINLLIEDYTTQFKSESSRPVFSAHDAFRRLSDRLGFTLVDSFADSAEKKPGIGHLKRMQEKIRALEKVCFLEELGTTSFYTKSIPAETDVKRAQIDLLGQTLTGTATYPEYLAQLLSTLRECTRL